MDLSSKQSLCSELDILACAGVRLARSGIFCHETIIFAMRINLFYWFEGLNSGFEVAYVVDMKLFSHCGCAACAKRDFFS